MSKVVFQLDTEPSFFESIIPRRSGTLLLTRQDANELWEVSPKTGFGRCIMRIPNAGSLTGSTEVNPDVYAVGAGIYRVATHEGSVPGSWSVWTIDLRHDQPRAAHVVKIPEIGQLNGITTWDFHTILVADSYHGRIYRVNLLIGDYAVCLEDETMKDSPKSPVRMGVNGIKVRRDKGVTWVYFTNTTRMLFARIPVDDNITAIGPVEVIASGSIPYDQAAGTIFEPLSSTTKKGLPWFMPDDFCFSADGTAYITSHPTNMVFRVSADGKDSGKIAGDLKSWEVAAATACAFGITDEDKDVLYVSTAGANVMPVDGRTEPAKVVALSPL